MDERVEGKGINALPLHERIDAVAQRFAPGTFARGEHVHEEITPASFVAQEFEDDLEVGRRNGGREEGFVDFAPFFVG